MAEENILGPDPNHISPLHTAFPTALEHLLFIAAPIEKSLMGVLQKGQAQLEVVLRGSRGVSCRNLATRSSPAAAPCLPSATCQSALWLPPTRSSQGATFCAP